MLSKTEYLNIISKNSRYDIDLIGNAYDYGLEKHKHQTRASGEPYFIHCIEVSLILFELNFDNETIVAALLHDVIEDCEVCTTEFKNKFGEEIYNLVDGVTKLNDYSNLGKKGKLANNYKKLILATTRDIRVILIKIADRIHNMTTIDNLRPDKRVRIANETMKLYIPIAAKLGITNWKDKLEDLCFKVLDNDARQTIVNRLDTLFFSKYNKLIDDIKEELSDVVSRYSKDFKIIGRVKKPYSIWKKIKQKDISFNRICDLVAFRIIVNDVDECYRVLGGVHQNYYVIPKRIKDYISLPKANGYRSIHTSVMGPKGHRVEVQIKTHEMHNEAEYGISSHLNYKKFDKIFNDKIFKKYRWLEQYFNLINEFNNTTEIIESNKYDYEVYVFSPKGEIFSLPLNSTVLDFAYLIHTEFGEKFAFARINGQIKDISYELCNGDQVEIIIDENNHPHEFWLNHVITSKAKNFIKKYIRESKKADFVKIGKEVFDKFVSLYHMNQGDFDVLEIINNKKFKNEEDMYMHIGQDKNLVDELFDLYKNHEKNSIHNDIKIFGMTKNMINCKIDFCDICMPILGDEIFAEYFEDRINIHRKTCQNIIQGNDIFVVDWNKNDDECIEYKAKIYLKVDYRQKSFDDIETMFDELNIKIYDYKILNFDDNYMELNVIIQVNDVIMLEKIMSHLKLSNGILYTSRG